MGMRPSLLFLLLLVLIIKDVLVSTSLLLPLGEADLVADLPESVGIHLPLGLLHRTHLELSNDRTSLAIAVREGVPLRCELLVFVEMPGTSKQANKQQERREDDIAERLPVSIPDSGENVKGRTDQQSFRVHVLQPDHLVPLPEAVACRLAIL